MGAGIRAGPAGHAPGQSERHPARGVHGPCNHAEIRRVENGSIEEGSGVRVRVSGRGMGQGRPHGDRAAGDAHGQGLRGVVRKGVDEHVPSRAESGRRAHAGFQCGRGVRTGLRSVGSDQGAAGGDGPGLCTLVQHISGRRAVVVGSQGDPLPRGEGPALDHGPDVRRDRGLGQGHAHAHPPGRHPHGVGQGVDLGQGRDHHLAPDLNVLRAGTRQDLRAHTRRRIRPRPGDDAPGHRNRPGVRAARSRARDPEVAGIGHGSFHPRDGRPSDVDLGDAPTDRCKDGPADAFALHGGILRVGMRKDHHVVSCGQDAAGSDAGFGAVPDVGLGTAARPREAQGAHRHGGGHSQHVRHSLGLRRQKDVPVGRGDHGITDPGFDAVLDHGLGDGNPDRCGGEQAHGERARTHVRVHEGGVVGRKGYISDARRSPGRHRTEAVDPGFDGVVNPVRRARAAARQPQAGDGDIGGYGGRNGQGLDRGFARGGQAHGSAGHVGPGDAGVHGVFDDVVRDRGPDGQAQTHGAHGEGEAPRGRVGPDRGCIPGGQGDGMGGCDASGGVVQVLDRRPNGVVNPVLGLGPGPGRAHAQETAGPREASGHGQGPEVGPGGG